MEHNIVNNEFKGNIYSKKGEIDLRDTYNF